MAKEKVFYFRAYDITRDRMVRSKRPATLSAIRALGPAMQPIPETEHEIDSSLLGEDGFRKRLTVKELADIMAGKNKGPSLHAETFRMPVRRAAEEQREMPEEEQA